MRARELFVCRPMKVAVSMVVAILMLSSLRLQAQTASAVVPFQGQLASQSGEPISPPKPLTLAFRLYENPVGGVALWEEIQPNIVVIAGRFNALLGSRNPFPDLKIFNRTVYLGITIDDGDPTTADVEMRPRQAIVPVISAISARNSDKLNGRDWSDLLVGGSNDPAASKIRADRIELGFEPAHFESNSAIISIRSKSIGTDLLSDQSITPTKMADGMISPIGSVVAYAGLIDTSHPLPGGWMLCDGQAMASVKYKELYAVLGTGYGDGRDDNDKKLTDYDFNLPDYRGYFLRGSDPAGKRDPDTDTRTAPRTGGNSKGQVGSVQTDDLKQHSHHFDLASTTYESFDGKHGPTNGLRGDDFYHLGLYPGGFNTAVAPADPAGKETRPKNAYVNWIIRVK